MIQTRDQAAAERAAQEERERRDWFDMMQSESAFRVWARLLEEMGANALKNCYNLSKITIDKNNTNFVLENGSRKP